MNHLIFRGRGTPNSAFADFCDVNAPTMALSPNKKLEDVHTMNSCELKHSSPSSRLATALCYSVWWALLKLLQSDWLFLLWVLFTRLGQKCEEKDIRTWRFPGGTSAKESTCQCRRQKRHKCDPWVRKIPWRRAWQPTPVYLPGESPWTEESGGLQSIEYHRVRHDWNNWEHAPNLGKLDNGKDMLLPFDSFEFSTEKNAQCESWGLSFIWGNMRTAAWETAPMIALRNCSKEIGLGGWGGFY